MAGSDPARSGGIFISYRRDEADYPASWLYERLVARFGRDQVFKDVDSIQLGDDFAEVITNAVGTCDVLLALIGPEWLTVTDEAGNRRLDKPDDFVRLEIETALKHKVRVIPVLIRNATMPRAKQVPASLAKLVRHQALQLSPNQFESDVDRLLPVLDKTIAEKQAKRAEEQRIRAALDEAIANINKEQAQRKAEEQAQRALLMAAIEKIGQQQSQRRPRS